MEETIMKSLILASILFFTALPAYAWELDDMNNVIDQTNFYRK